MSDNASALTAAICAVMSEVGGIQPTGKNSHHRYDYLSSADLLGRIQPAMARNGLAMHPAVIVSRTEGKAVVLEVQYDLRHTSGEVVTVASIGVGDGPKAHYAAMTGAHKYAVRQAFGIPDREDPEADHNHGPAPTPERVREERKSESPADAAKRRDGHDADWEADRGRFCAVLKDPHGLDYDTEKAWALANGMAAPSTWGRQGRAAFVRDLAAGKAVEVHEWAARGEG